MRGSRAALLHGSGQASGATRAYIAIEVALAIECEPGGHATADATH